MSPRKKLAAVVFVTALLGLALFLWKRSMTEPEPTSGRYTLQWGPGQRRWVIDTATGDMWHECGFDDVEGTKWCAEPSPREAQEMARHLARYRSEQADREIARDMADAGEFTKKPPP